MSIEVIEIEEQPDGTARMILDIDEKTVGLLIESAVITALEQYIDRREVQYQPNQLELENDKKSKEEGLRESDLEQY